MRASRIKTERRLRRKRGLRKRIRGTSESPRLTVFRSAKHIYAQIIDDSRGVTICQASTRDKELRERVGDGGNAAAAAIVGTAIGERGREKQVESICFDRNGFRYHGRIKSLADAAREAGLKF